MKNVWQKEIKRENSMCRLNSFSSEMYVRNTCSVFNCPSFRTKRCRKQAFLSELADVDSINSSQAWINQTDYIVKVVHSGDNSDESLMQMFDDFRYLRDSFDVDDSMCGFEFEMLCLQQAVLTALKKEI